MANPSPRDRRIDNYFNFVYANQWHPRTMLEGFRPFPEPTNREWFEHMVHFCKLGATNEGDAYLIAASADKNPDIASDPLWRLFAPFWLRDEAQHAEAYFRILVACKLVQERDWARLLLDEIGTHGPHREAFYRDCPAFQNRVMFWAAIAVDEWNTAREYSSAARTVFRCLGPTPGDVQRRLAADEVQHHEYAVGALVTIGLNAPERREEIVEACQRVATWANENGQPSGNTDQFMFDQEPVPGTKFVPSFNHAALDVIKKCERAWENAA